MQYMKKFSKEKELEIINLYKRGFTQKEIADKYGTFNTSIRRVLLRNNVFLKVMINNIDYVNTILLKNMMKCQSIT